MNVLIVGSGGREHALAWKLKQSPEVSHVFAAPGNAGTASLGTNWPDIAATAVAALTDKAKAENIALAVIGPESPLAAGLADSLRQQGLAVFGPNRNGARLESSKSYAKQFMERNGISTARHRVAHDRKQAEKLLAHWPDKVVLKADGLAGGKGVVVCANTEEARDTLADWYGRHALPGGGSEIVLEDALLGPEVSVMAILDGSHYVVLSPACDYKRADEGDAGPNTGGVGAYSSSSDVLTEEALRQIRELVFDRALEGLRQAGIDYRGCLYAGLMLTKTGPKVLEFNARFGDPEIQAILPRLQSDFYLLLQAAAVGRIDGAPVPTFIHKACVAIVLTSEGYPQIAQPVKNLPGFAARDNEVTAFWGGSKIVSRPNAAEPGSSLVEATGGRVLTICALGEDIEKARARAYAACQEYERRLPPGVTLRYRRDIASRVVTAVR